MLVRSYLSVYTYSTASRRLTLFMLAIWMSVGSNRISFHVIQFVLHFLIIDPVQELHLHIETANFDNALITPNLAFGLTSQDHEIVTSRLPKPNHHTSQNTPRPSSF